MKRKDNCNRMEKQVGLYEKVYDYILEQIFHQKLSYGQKVPEEEISKDLALAGRQSGRL